MSPQPYLAPRVWKRPYTSIYKDNYRYGNSLYSSAIDDIERKYNESLARTSFKPDRPDLHFESFADQRRSSQPSIEIGKLKKSFINSGYDATLNYDSFPNESKQLATSSFKQTVSDFKPSETYNTYQSVKNLSSMEADLEENKTRRRRKRETNDYLLEDINFSRPNYGYISPSSLPSLDSQNQTLLTERWYNKSLRSVLPSLNRLS